MTTTATAEPLVCECLTPNANEHFDRIPCLGQYVEAGAGRVRQIISLTRPDGSVLVVDRLASSAGDSRVVARLAPSEPPENASIVAEIYLFDERRGRCRPLTAEDLQLTRPTPSPASTDSSVLNHAPLLDGEGYCYRVCELVTGRSVPELRWARSPLHGEADPETVTLRDVVGRLQSYEPATALTIKTLAVYRDDRSCSTCTLAGELARLQASPIVLNRGLREAVLAAVKNRGLSMSQIALCCGRTKRDRGGSISGETSWLARRIGQLPESGEQYPSPWVHSDVLALIARDGLNVCPREVELD